jgi:hypothetical protein
MRKCGPFLVLALLLTGGATLHAQAFASAAAARDLVSLLDRFRLDAIAAVDPTAPGAFVAALYIPGTQLLVVNARQPSVEGVMQHLTMHQYREVYLDLQGTPTPANKFFVQDAGADGILSVLPGSGEVDVLYEDGVRQTLFNGDLKAQHLTTAEYDARLAAADAQYARLLRLLTEAVREMRQPTTESGQ